MREAMSVVKSHFTFYDCGIIILGILTFFIWFISLHATKKLDGKLRLHYYVPDDELSQIEINEEITQMSQNVILDMKKKMWLFYSIFSNMTGIFPLLGILGTVISLLGVVNDSHDITGNFFSALTSTFWGLVFAIIFKALDSIIIPNIEETEKNASRYLDKKREKNDDKVNAP